jgi:hypothetical protein
VRADGGEEDSEEEEIMSSFEEKDASTMSHHRLSDKSDFSFEGTSCCFPLWLH